MAYRIIYPKMLQLFSVSFEDEAAKGALIVDWNQYGIFSRDSHLDVSLVQRDGCWQVDTLSMGNVDVFYLDNFKTALNFYLKQKIGSYVSQCLSSQVFSIFYFEKVCFDISLSKSRLLWCKD